MTNSGTCTDKAGNVADSSTVSEINIDKSSPLVNIASPVNEAHYTFHQVVLADWTVNSDISGTQSLDFTTLSGSPIDTSYTGVKSYHVIATDNSDNNTDNTVSYTVDPYKYFGPLSPISIDSKTFKNTSTIPVKFQLKNVNNDYIGNAVATLKIDSTPAISSGGSNLGNTFRYDISGNQYIYNLSTKMTVLSKGSHTLNITLDDGTLPHTQTILIK